MSLSSFLALPGYEASEVWGKICSQQPRHSVGVSVRTLLLLIAVAAFAFSGVFGDILTCYYYE